MTGTIEGVTEPPAVVEFSPLRVRGAARPDETILDVARRNGVPIGNSCGAVGVCRRCTVRIVSGAESLSLPTRLEQQFLEQGKLVSGERLACQTLVRGACVVTTSYWG